MNNEQEKEGCSEPVRWICTTITTQTKETNKQAFVLFSSIFLITNKHKKQSVLILVLSNY